MYKKVSGYTEPQDTDKVKEEVVKGRENFFEVMGQLRGKKDEYKEIKEKRVKRMKDQAKEEKESQKFKFGAMERKDPFKNAVRWKGYFQKQVEIHEPARDYREREALIFPDKVKEHHRDVFRKSDPTGYFTKMVGREVDKYDQDKQKYFEKPSRPDGSTIKMASIKNPDGTISWEKQQVKWHATKHKCEEIGHVKPLIDNTLTPRGRTKAISLERNYEKKKKWIHNDFVPKEFKVKEVKKSYKA
ncbi:unnamed protein product [Moneuplotes crassus]|uniref:Uncharacterized protein n=1 Tax=Euplotes crassus TaxID=5936 RepID=A0AAD1XW13_EUPCR|nr:unnamed protein product [Moneuplotes crassus]